MDTVAIWTIINNIDQWYNKDRATGAVVPGTKILGGAKFQYWTGERDSGSPNSPQVRGHNTCLDLGAGNPCYTTDIDKSVLFHC